MSGAVDRSSTVGVHIIHLIQGTHSSKKKKAAKLKRAMQAVKKAERRQAGSVSESFAAMQLLHDPQVCIVFASKAFSDRILKSECCVASAPPQRASAVALPIVSVSKCLKPSTIRASILTIIVARQTFAKRLSSRLQKANERLEAEVAMTAVISRDTRSLH